MNRYVYLFSKLGNGFKDYLVLDTQEACLLDDLPEGADYNKDRKPVFLEDGVYCCEEFGIYVRELNYIIAFAGKLMSMEIVPWVVLGYERDSNKLFLTDMTNTDICLCIFSDGSYDGSVSKFTSFKINFLGEYKGNAGAILTRYIV